MSNTESKEGWGVLGGSALLAGLAGVQNAVSIPIGKSMKSDTSLGSSFHATKFNVDSPESLASFEDYGDRQMATLRRLKEISKAEGAPVINTTMDGYLPSIKKNLEPGFLEGIIKKISPKMAENMQEHRSAVNRGLEALRGESGTKGVVLLGENKNIGALAHEIGHLRGGKLLARINTGGKYGALAGILGAAYSGDETLGATAAGLGTVGAAGTLYSEIDASSRGAKLLKKVVESKAVTGGNAIPVKNLLKNISRVPFKGLPTYAALTALPALAYGTKKLLGGYDA